MLIIAFDLGTGGTKASIYDEQGRCLCSHFEEYQTLYPHPGWHEQRPEDWWQAVVNCTKTLMGNSGVNAGEIRYLAISGHSMCVVPVDAQGRPLRNSVPIWSDTRAKQQADAFFAQIPYEDWYRTTGNGFSRECYAAFKTMWYRDNDPELYASTACILGTKDFINLRLTGEFATDNSYASGSGVYNLKKRAYEDAYVRATGLKPSLFPRILASHDVVGRILPDMADMLGLSRELCVMAGGVDNSCMAVGAGNIKDGRVYLSLGSSAWIAVSSKEPVIEGTVKPFVFDHVIPSLYTSATSIFSAGNSLRWASNAIWDYKHRSKSEQANVYDLMVADAATSPIGANGLLFNPSLAGAPAAYGQGNVEGAFLGLQLRHTPADMCRAVLEGIAMDLCLMHRKLEKLCTLDHEIVIVGGGSRNGYWRQLFADVFGRSFVRISTDQDAASLGAAAIAAVGAGLWTDYAVIDSVIERREYMQPNVMNSQAYMNLLSKYERIIPLLSVIGEIMND